MSVENTFHTSLTRYLVDHGPTCVTCMHSGVRACQNWMCEYVPGVSHVVGNGLGGVEPMWLKALVV